MYNKIFSNLSQILKALAHPRRLEIVYLLREQELPVTDIYSMLDLPQANISQHLMLMRTSGVVATKKIGKKIYYHLADKKVIEICDSLRDLALDLIDDQELSKALKITMKELVPVKTDPVCLMRVSPKTAGASCVHQGKRYYFCASGCVQRFKQEPGKYLRKIKNS